MSVASLPLPTAEHHVVAAGPTQEVVLWKACRHAELADLLTHRTAAGRRAGETGPPTELTTSNVRARAYAWCGFVVSLAVRRDHLTKRSDSTTGWLCPPGTPVRLLGYASGQG